ncbi:MAG: hypothetical protein ABSE73_28740 [Planctomycetota bacterium]
MDIIVKRAKRTAAPKRPRGTRQALAREVEAGPVTLRVQVLVYRRCDQQNRQLGRSWVLYCRTPQAVQHVRQRLRDLMRQLDGACLVEEDPPGPGRAQGSSPLAAPGVPNASPLPGGV